MKKWIIALLAGIVISCGSKSEHIKTDEVKSPQATTQHTEYYNDGSVKMKGGLKGEKRIGKWESFYPNGYKWSEVTYRDGLKHGPTIVYYENGIMRYQGYYHSDNRSDLWVFYDTTGTVVKRVNLNETEIIPDSLFSK